ncbi:MAG: hypothetical protein KKD39_05520 [Candidatus Altiarchaeota archaeon]|nr:hypothetical protein [Candidatus Altiarchaeota archaeon]
MASKLTDERYISGRVSSLAEHEFTAILPLKEIVRKATATFTHGDIDCGEGHTVRIDRQKMEKLYSAFPAVAQDDAVKELLQPAQGKGVVIWGAGNVGLNAAENVKQMGATNVAFIDISDAVLTNAAAQYGGEKIAVSKNITPAEKERIMSLLASDKVHALNIGVLLPGDKAPQLLSREDLTRINTQRAEKGLPALIIADAAIDQGGCVEGEKATTHDCPIRVIAGSPVISVANVPGSRYTAGYASKLLQEATLDDLKKIILATAFGWDKVFADDPTLKTAINTMGGKITYPKVSEVFNQNPSSTVDEAVDGAPKPVGKKVKLAIPAAIKAFEHRAGILPTGVEELLRWAPTQGIDLEVGLDVRLGEGIVPTPGVEEISTEAYERAGGKIYNHRHELMAGANVLHFTKEPQGDELQYIEPGSAVHTYFHYTGFPEKLVKWALDKNITSVAFETREDAQGKLPCLKPMSHVDGRSNTLIIGALFNPEIMELKKPSNS